MDSIVKHSLGPHVKLGTWVWSREGFCNLFAWQVVGPRVWKRIIERGEEGTQDAVWGRNVDWPVRDSDWRGRTTRNRGVARLGLEGTHDSESRATLGGVDSFFLEPGEVGGV